NHSGHRAYPDALFLLGESLYKAGDYLGARSRYRQVIDRSGEGAFRPYSQRSLGRLIEIAIHIRDFDGVDSYFQQLSSLPAGQMEASTNYFRAKYLYNRAVPAEDDLDGTAAPQLDLGTLEQARQLFDQVSAEGEYGPQARYFIGVIHTLRSEFPQAIEAFRRVLRSEASTPEQREVIDLTHLALGRLYYETDQLDQAVEAYQAVPRTSERFDIALYEIAWVYIRLGDSTRAERALEVLAVAAPDSRFIPDGKVLRGNLLLRNGRFEDATTVFREVREEFGPIYEELEAIRERHAADLPAYFRGLVRENLDDFDVENFLPEQARRYTDLGSDFTRAVNVLSDLSQSRRLVRETQSLINRLNGAIGGSNRVSVFTDLREQREGTTSIRNRAARIRRQLIRWEERNVGGGGPELASIRSERRRVEEELGSMPTQGDDFLARDDQMLSRYRRLQRELADLEVALLGMDARIVATESFINATREQQQNLEGVESELAQQRAAVAAYREEIEAIEGLIEVARLQVGVGDVRYQRDERLRDEYARLVAEERRLSGGTSSRAAPLFQRVRSLESQIDARDREIDERVDERVASMRSVIDEESANLVRYREQIQSLEGETEEVVGGVTQVAFSDVRDRFYDLVLRAEVGRIDVSWADREEHRQRVDLLTRERSRELQALDDEFRDIMDEGSEEEATP
ncbi:MAG: tetratricopeptide repeat protein, partial [Myxococcota bacterium]